jgi:two-component system cell cycle response regulator
MLTSSENQRTTIKAFRAGIEDFVPKRGLRSADLTQAIEKAVMARAADDARHGEFEKLRREAAFDPVTGFYSRREIDERLIRLAEGIDRRQGRFAVIACALDGIQTLVDGFGLVLGDRAMRMTASRLQKVIRGTDICARYESAVLLYVIDTDVSQVTVDAICGRLREALSFEFRSDNIRVPIVATCGAAYYPVDGEVPGELVANAMARISDRPESLAAPAVAILSASPIARTPVAVPAQPEESRGENNRRHRRQRVLKTARIVLHDGYSTIDCTVRDISDAGARLRVQDAFTAPETFVLTMLDTGVSRKVVRRWQAGGNVGVEFLT